MKSIGICNLLTLKFEISFRIIVAPRYSLNKIKIHLNMKEKIMTYKSMIYKVVSSNNLNPNKLVD